MFIEWNEGDAVELVNLDDQALMANNCNPNDAVLQINGDKM